MFNELSSVWSTCEGALDDRGSHYLTKVYLKHVLMSGAWLMVLEWHYVTYNCLCINFSNSVNSTNEPVIHLHHSSCSPQYFTPNHESKEHISNPYNIVRQGHVSNCRMNSLKAIHSYMYGPIKIATLYFIIPS